MVKVDEEATYRSSSITLASTSELAPPSLFYNLPGDSNCSVSFSTHVLKTEQSRQVLRYQSPSGGPSY